MQKLKYPNLYHEMREHGNFNGIKSSLSEVANITDALFDKILVGEADLLLEEAYKMSQYLTHFGTIQPCMGYLYSDRLRWITGYKRSHVKKIYRLYMTFYQYYAREHGGLDRFYVNTIMRIMECYKKDNYLTMAEYRHFKAIINDINCMCAKGKRREE